MGGEGEGDMMISTTSTSPNNSILSSTQQTLNSVLDETRKDFSNLYGYLMGSLSTTSTGGKKSKTKRRTRRRSVK